MPSVRTALRPAEALIKAKQLWKSIDRRAQDYSTKFTSTVDRRVVYDCWSTFIRFSANLDAIKDVPGLKDYAIEQENDPAYDIVVEFIALIDAVDAVVTEIDATVPTDGAGFLLEKKMLPSGDFQQGTFPPAALANLRTLLDAVAAQVI